MKKRRILSMIMTIVMLMSLVPVITFTAAAQPGPNLLTNADFESGPANNTNVSATNVPGWALVSGGSGSNLRYRSVAADSRSGTGYIDTWATTSGTNRTIRQTVSNVQPGAYNASIWLGGNNGTATWTLTVSGTNVQGSPRSISVTRPASSGNGAQYYTELAISDIVVTGAGNITFDIRFDRVNADVWATCDDAYFGLVDVNAGLDPNVCTVSQNGSASTPTTSIILNFDEPVEGLTAANINIDPPAAAVKGTPVASNGNRTWTLPVSGVMQGPVTVSLSGVTGHFFHYANQQITLFADAVAFTASQDGSATSTTTALNLTFNKSVTGLTAASINLSPASAAIKGELTGSGTNWSLALSNINPGPVTVSIPNIPGFTFSPAAAGADQTTLYRVVAQRTFTAHANGFADLQSTTQVELRFNAPVLALSLGDVVFDPPGVAQRISIAPNNDFTVWTLRVRNTTQGPATVNITNNLDYSFAPEGTGNQIIINKDPDEIMEQPVRQEVDFNDNWRYNRGAASGAQNTAYDDSGWTVVGLPHTTGYVTYEYSGSANGTGARAYYGVYWYRKTIQFPESLEGKQVYIHFGAAMNQSTFYVNGTQVGSYQGGYMGFTYDITQWVQADIAAGRETILAIQCDSTMRTTIPPGRTSDPDFQMHSGLYRGVKLFVNEPVHITDELWANTPASGGVFIHADTNHSFSASTTSLGISSYQGSYVTGDRTGLVPFWIGVHVRNTSAAAASVTVKNELYDPDGILVWEATSAASNIAAGAASQITMTTGGANPAAPRLKLWHPHSPWLHMLKTSVYVDGVLVDEKDTRTGFRNVTFSNTNGGANRANKMVINGENWFGLGTNTHQEIGMVGYAVTEDAVRDEVRLIKDAGYDYIRLSHYPYSRWFIEACDEFGVMVQQPITGWQSNFTTNATAAANSLREARDMIRRDRNSPSVFTWELAINEGGMSTSFTSDILAAGRAEFPTRQMITSGNASFEVRYLHSRSAMGSNSYPQMYFEYGDWQMGGYTASTRHMRWNASEDKTRIPVANFQAAMDRAHGSAANMSFYWVWQDYTGFGTGAPDVTYPNVGSGGTTSNLNGYPIPSGMVDMYRIPKYAYYYAQSQRSGTTNFFAGLENLGVRTGYMIHIGTRWFDTTPVKSGETAVTDVPVFTNAPFVRLYGSTDGVNWTRIGTNKTAWDSQRPPHANSDANGTTYAQTTNYTAGTASRQWTFSNISHDNLYIKAVGLSNSTDDPLVNPALALAEYIVRKPTNTTAAKVDITWQSDWNSDGTKTPGRVDPLIANGGDKRLLYINILDDQGFVKSNSGLVTTTRTLTAAQYNASGLTNTNPVTVTVTKGDAWILGGETANAVGAKTATIVPRGGQVAVWVVAGTTAYDDIEITATSPGLIDGLAEITTIPRVGFWGEDDDGGGVVITDDDCVAYGKPATASGSAEDQEPGLAVDGNEDTYWEANVATAGVTWQVDLEENYELSELEILWGESSAYQYKIEYSRDAQTWIALFDKTANTASEESTVLTVSGSAKSARYVRITFTSAAAAPFRIAEFHVNGLLAVDPALMITGMDAWWGDASMGVTPARQGSDGDPSSSATAANSLGGNQWVTDLLGVYDVDNLRITWENHEHAYKYKVEFSTDGESWGTVRFNSRNSVTYETLDTFTPAVKNARFLRVTSAPDTAPMSFNLLSLGATAATNLALGKNAVGSGTGAFWAVDEDDGTLWVPAAPGDALTIDLAAAYTVSAVRLAWPTEALRAYTLEASADGIEWQEYWTGTSDGLEDLHSITSVGVRYLRLVSTDGASLGSFDVFGDTVAARNIQIGDDAALDSGWVSLANTDTAAVTIGSNGNALISETPPYSASLHQAMAGLPDGWYKFAATVSRGFTGQSELYAYIENYGSDTLIIDLTDIAAGQDVLIEAIVEVTGGKASIGFFLSVNANIAAFVNLNISGASFTRIKEPSFISYTVTFNANGGVGSLDPVVVELDDGASVTIPGGTGFSRANHSFAGWSLTANGVSGLLKQGDVIVVSDDTVLYAQWTRTAVGIGPGPILVPSW